MALPPGLQISFENEPSWEDRETIDEALGAHNAPFLDNPGYSYFGVFVRDGTRTIHAGLIGNCYAGWLFTRSSGMPNSLGSTILPGTSGSS